MLINRLEDCIFSMADSKYNTTEAMINKLKLYQKISNYYDEVHYKQVRLDEDPFSKNVKG